MRTAARRSISSSAAVRPRRSPDRTASRRSSRSRAALRRRRAQPPDDARVELALDEGEEAVELRCAEAQALGEEAPRPREDALARRGDPALHRRSVHAAVEAADRVAGEAVEVVHPEDVALVAREA